MDRILLIDGANLMWRACVKFPSAPPKPKFDAAGNPIIEPPKEQMPDEVIFTFNFFRNLRPLIADVAPDKCFFVLEGHPQFRYDLFPEYKANRLIKLASTRKDSNDRFLKTKDIIVPLLQYLPITVCSASNYEADDVIAALCEDMREEDLTVLSNDSDYIQLLQRGYSKIHIYNPIKKEDMEAPPYPYVAWKCLNGDKSDNIPAILKPKKALDTISNPVLFKKFMEVEENRANFNINRQLIEFRSVPLEEINMKEGDKNFSALHQAFVEMKFDSITNDKSWGKFKSTFDCIKY